MHPECASPFYWRMCLDTTWLLFRVECWPFLSFHGFPVRREQLLWGPCHLFIKYFSIIIQFSVPVEKQQHTLWFHLSKQQTERSLLRQKPKLMREGSRQRFDVVRGVCLLQMTWKSLEAGVKNTLEVHSRSGVAAPCGISSRGWLSVWHIAAIFLPAGRREFERFAPGRGGW